jgi:hypothetical protein
VLQLDTQDGEHLDEGFVQIEWLLLDGDDVGLQLSHVEEVSRLEEDHIRADTDQFNSLSLRRQALFEQVVALVDDCLQRGLHLV